MPYVASSAEAFLQKYYALDERFGQGYFARRFTGIDYEVRSCDSCGLVFQAWRPGPVLSAEVYGKWIRTQPDADRTMPNVSLREYVHATAEAQKIAHLLFGERELLSEMRALDFGMGRGVFALALKACGFRTFGHDVGAQRHEAGGRMGIEMLAPGAATQDTFAGHTFDFVNTEQVFEHLPNPGEILELLVKALRPGGLLKISVPRSRALAAGRFDLDFDAPKYAANAITPVQPLEHLQYYPPLSIDTLARRFGLRRLRIPAKVHMLYDNRWITRQAFRNVARTFAHEKLRNYTLLRKPSGDA